MQLKSKLVICRLLNVCFMKHAHFLYLLDIRSKSSIVIHRWVVLEANALAAVRQVSKAQETSMLRA